MRFRLAIRFAIAGDLRFISHHDTLRLFERALARAELPMRFSEGFNPRPRLRLAVPRPVGVSSSDELLVVEFAEDVEPDRAMAALADQMPQGLALQSADRLADTDQRRPCEATYELPVGPDQADPVAKRITEFLASDKVLVERTAPKAVRRKSVDIRSFVRCMEIADGRLVWTQTISQDGTARPSELLEAIGLPSREHLHLIRRTGVIYQT